MTPQLQQAIRLLQLASLDLQAHVRETLETNVMLEGKTKPLEVVPEAVQRDREDAAVTEEKYAELDGNSAVAVADQREEPEVEIADEAWGEQTSGPSDTPGRVTTTAAAISATSTARPCRNSSSSNWNSPKLSAIDLGDRARHRRRHHRRRLSEGFPRGHSRQPAAGNPGRSATDVERVLARRSIAGAGRRRCPQPGRMHCAAAAPARSGHAGARRRDSGGARAPGSGRRPAVGAAAPAVALQRRRSGNGAGAGALLPSAPRRGGQLRHRRNT